MYFEFERLHVYKVTLDFVAASDDVAKTLLKGWISYFASSRCRPR